jgi:ketosteroid isomerase-like protein
MTGPHDQESPNRRIVADLVSNYTNDAVLDLGGENVFRSTDAIKLALENFLAAGLPIKTNLKHVTQAGDTAFVIFHWIIAGVAPDGKAVKMEGTANDVLHRGGDGNWRQFIDLPFGIDTN